MKLALEPISACCCSVFSRWLVADASQRNAGSYCYFDRTFIPAAVTHDECCFFAATEKWQGLSETLPE